MQNTCDFLSYLFSISREKHICNIIFDFLFSDLTLDFYKDQNGFIKRNSNCRNTIRIRMFWRNTLCGNAGESSEIGNQLFLQLVFCVKIDNFDISLALFYMQCYNRFHYLPKELVDPWTRPVVYCTSFFCCVLPTAPVPRLLSLLSAKCVFVPWQTKAISAPKKPCGFVTALTRP